MSFMNVTDSKMADNSTWESDGHLQYNRGDRDSWLGGDSGRMADHRDPLIPQRQPNGPSLDLDRWADNQGLRELILDLHQKVGVVLSSILE